MSQTPREHLGVFLNVHVCEKALIWKITLLAEIHLSIRFPIIVGRLSTLCRGRNGGCKAYKVRISYMISYNII
jgi:hypothetical protein